MENRTTSPGSLTNAYAETAMWYWDAVGHANEHAIHCLKSLSFIMWQANPMSALATFGAQEAVRSGARFEEAMQEASTSARHNGAANVRQAAPATKSSARRRTAARNGRRSK